MVSAGAERRVPALRRAGYQLLGGGFDYLLHLRPAEWPIMAVHTALGYVLAVGAAGLREGHALGPAALGLLIWVVCLNGGTLAINSAFDRDEADIAYLRQPPAPPRHLFAFGMALMVAGLAAAIALLPRSYTLAYAACLVLSIAYSVPPIRLKAVAGADWATNMVGFGALTPLAGWFATGLPLRLPEATTLLAFAPLFGALYPLTQLYQLEDDRARGDRTLAIRLGTGRSLTLALGAAGIAFGAFGIAGVFAGWGMGDAWRWMLLGVALVAWLAVLIPWRLGAVGMTPRQHERGMYRALIAWALTDAAVVGAWLG